MDYRDIRKELAFIVFGVIAIIFAMVIWVSVQLEVKNAVDRMNARQPDIETMYDSPSSNLIETESTCPECGELSMGINDNIVCRNEDCPNYGLAVPIDSRN